MHTAYTCLQKTQHPESRLKSDTDDTSCHKETCGCCQQLLYGQIEGEEGPAHKEEQEPNQERYKFRD